MATFNNTPAVVFPSGNKVTVAGVMSDKKNIVTIELTDHEIASLMEYWHEKRNKTIPQPYTRR